jgi:hypothetical protein
MQPLWLFNVDKLMSGTRESEFVFSRISDQSGGNPSSIYVFRPVHCLLRSTVDSRSTDPFTGHAHSLCELPLGLFSRFPATLYSRDYLAFTLLISFTTSRYYPWKSPLILVEMLSEIFLLVVRYWPPY